MSDIAANFEVVLKKIRRAEKSAGREEGRCALMAVTKTQPVEAIRAALEAGHRLFGENKVQEAQAHWAALKEEGRFPGLRLHMIGPLQTNKAGDAVSLFDCIESIDRPKLVQALAQEMRKQGRDIPCYIQVNTGEEPQKAGVLPQDLEALLAQCGAEGLRITGLMCIPPEGVPAALHFAFLKKLALRHGLPELSMGMSGDYEKAAMLGAHHVRIGSALFGART